MSRQQRTLAYFGIVAIGILVMLLMLKGDKHLGLLYPVGYVVGWMATEVLNGYKKG